MSACRWSRQVEKWFDGELPPEAAGAVSLHVEKCEACASVLASMRRIREVASETVSRQEIADGQFGAFMEGICEGIEPAGRGWGRFWAAASVSAAALIAAVSAFVVVSDEPQKVDATVVESCTTDLEGATVRTYEDEAGDTTIAVTMSKDDIW